MDYVEGNRNNFVHQLACNLNRKGISYAEALGFILSDYNYNEIEVMNAVKSAYNNTHEFGTDREYKSPKTKETTKPKSSTTNCKSSAKSGQCLFIIGVLFLTNLCLFLKKGSDYKI